MSTLYLAAKHAHIALVSLSGALFAARGLAVLSGAAWPMRRWARTLSVVIDTLLLTAGLTLWLWLGLNPLQQHWLGAKLVLLLLYIMLGSLALKRARTRQAKAASLAAALAVFGFMVSVALAHHPAGLFAHLLFHA